MKKLLLTAFAATAALFAGAQTYTAEAVTSNDADWDESGYFDGSIMLDEPVSVEVFDEYVIIRNFLGGTSVDLKVAFDADENVTGVTPITDGVEGSTFTSGFAAFQTNSDAYYYVQLYLASGYDFAGIDENGGYVTISGYFYADESIFTFSYYNISWEAPAEDEGEKPIYTTIAQASVDEDYAQSYDGAFLPEAEATVEYFADHIMLRGWTGMLGDDLCIKYDEDDNITYIGAYADEELLGETTGGYLSFNISNPTYYYAQLYVYPQYVYAGADETEGYVFLSGYFYKSSTDYEWLYYYLPWDVPVGVENVAADNEAPVYYNLQGMRVENPSNGIYIVRQGNKTHKTLIR